MEAKVNESAYEALKTLNKEGDLKFDMGYVHIVRCLFRNLTCL